MIKKRTLNEIRQVKDSVYTVNTEKTNEVILKIVNHITDLSKNNLYELINEFIFDEGLVDESDDTKYQEIFQKIYEKIVWKLAKNAGELRRL